MSLFLSPKIIKRSKQQNQGHLKTVRLFWLMLTGVLLVVGVFFFPTYTALSKSSYYAFYSEAGPIERLTLLFYLFSLYAVGVGLRIRRIGLFMALIITLAILREMDWHNSFTSYSIFSKSFYTKGAELLIVRMCILGSIITLVGLLLWLVRPSLKGLWGNIRAKEPYALTTATLIILFPTTKLIDGAPRLLLKHLNYQMGDFGLKLMLACEEVIEMVLPILIILAIAQYLIAINKQETYVN